MKYFLWLLLFQPIAPAVTQTLLAWEDTAFMMMFPCPNETTGELSAGNRFACDEYATDEHCLTATARRFSGPAYCNTKLAGCRPLVIAQIDAEGNLDLDPVSFIDGADNSDGLPADLRFTLEFNGRPPNCNDAFLTEQPVSLIVTDKTGQSSGCTSRVAVEDTIPPVLECQNAVLVLDITSGDNIFDPVDDEVIAFSSDNCGLAYDIDFTGPFIYDCSFLGDNEVRIFQSDVNGNRSHCDVIITVIDPWLTCDHPPTALCRPKVSARIDGGGNLVLHPSGLDRGSYDDITQPEDLILRLELENAALHSGDPDSLLSRTVTLIVTDEVGQSGTCTSQVLAPWPAVNPIPRRFQPSA